MAGLAQLWLTDKELFAVGEELDEILNKPNAPDDPRHARLKAVLTKIEDAYPQVACRIASR